MGTRKHQITVDSLVVDVVRKNIKHLNLRVYAPDGRVRVSAPLRVDDEAVRLTVISKMAWIERKRGQMRAQSRKSAPGYVSGESHYYQGNRYLLNVVHQAGRPNVAIRGRTALDLFVQPGSDRATRERVLLAWYRARLKQAMPPLIARWEPIVGVKVAEWRVRRMKTRWGSCNRGARRIWVSLELAKQPVRCLEYIVVHEMVHLLERRHNDRFAAFMDAFLPQWRRVREELNQGPADRGRARGV